MNRKQARRHVMSFAADYLEDYLSNDAELLVGEGETVADGERIEEEARRLIAELRKRAGEHMPVEPTELNTTEETES